jgi:hypothetical protein
LVVGLYETYNIRFYFFFAYPWVGMDYEDGH